MSTNFCMILLVLYYWVRSSRLLIFLWIPAYAAATAADNTNDINTFFG